MWNSIQGTFFYPDPIGMIIHNKKILWLSMRMKISPNIYVYMYKEKPSHKKLRWSRLSATGDPGFLEVEYSKGRLYNGGSNHVKEWIEEKTLMRKTTTLTAICLQNCQPYADPGVAKEDIFWKDGYGRYEVLHIPINLRTKQSMINNTFSYMGLLKVTLDPDLVQCW